LVLRDLVVAIATRGIASVFDLFGPAYKQRFHRDHHPWISRALAGARVSRGRNRQRGDWRRRVRFGEECCGRCGRCTAESSITTLGLRTISVAARVSFSRLLRLAQPDRLRLQPRDQRP
jgi:hypothetical protein